MLLSCYFWLLAFFVFRIGRPNVRLDQKIIIDGRAEWSIRCALLVLYLSAALVALPAFWLGKASNFLNLTGRQVLFAFPFLRAAMFCLIF